MLQNMDSKYSEIGNNRPTVPKFHVKSKPTPILINASSSPKKVKLENGEKFKSNNSQVMQSQKAEIDEQKRLLPIYGVRNRLLEEIKRNQTLIIIGETGSGKTTQIPQFMYSLRLQNEGKIAVTQPRRVAAISIATRVSAELGCDVGDTVGYSVRFEDVTRKHTKIIYQTDGMLLREAMKNPLLLKYNVVILDEAHERTVHTDVLFGIVKEAQKIRKQQMLPLLKVIIMSATMDVDHFSKYFNNCGTIYIEGRLHPIDVFHSVRPQNDYQFSCLVTVFKIHREAPAEHDILVFLTGQDEIETMTATIRNTAKDIKLSRFPTIKVIPLYAALPSELQMEVFKPAAPNCRKVILSTNVAETSLTISGIRYVIDSGMVKQRSYHASTGLETLKITKVSKAQAWQRTGRSGREAKGFCYRMYTKEEFQLMRETTVPEIQRCNLTNVCLQLLALKINAMNFDFMDAPSKESLKQAFETLKLLGAIESVEHKKLTKLGQQMALFPLDPKYSKILLSTKDFGCYEEILSIISVLSSENVFYSPSNKQEQAIQARHKFTSPYGDHVTLLNVFRSFNNASNKKQWCYENYLNYRNLAYAKEVRTQLDEICKKCELPVSSCGSQMDPVRKCLLTGLFMNVAELYRSSMNDKHYITVDTNQKASIHPSSVLHGLLPPLVLFTEVIHTNKCYLKYLTLVEADWLQEIAPDYMQTHKLSAFTRGN